MSWQDDERICPVCGGAFYPTQHNQIYDTLSCKDSAMNARAYEAHKEEKRARTAARRIAQRDAGIAATKTAAYQAGYDYALGQLGTGAKQVDMAAFESTPFAKRPGKLRALAMQAFAEGVGEAAAKFNIVVFIQAATK